MLNAAILANETRDDHLIWIKACNNYSEKIRYDVIDLTKHNWYEKLTSSNYDILLVKPPGLSANYKQLFDERIHIIDTVLKIPLFPTPTEIYIYENKRYLYSWLKANKIPHPSTFVFYNENEAKDYVKKTSYPIVSKINIGASGSGVKIINNEIEAIKYIQFAFSSNGINRRWWPNFSNGNFIKRGMHYIFNVTDIRKQIDKYRKVKNDIQKGFVIFQEYIKHDYEWRIVAIGDSYFAHKKIKVGEKASGSLLKKYDNPPLKLFDFAKDLVNRFGLTSQAIDVFETEDRNLLINEMQCIFGQSDEYQMKVDGKIGRYRLFNGNWTFEEGDFNKNESYNLRVESIISMNN